MKASQSMGPRARDPPAWDENNSVLTTTAFPVKSIYLQHIREDKTLNGQTPGFFLPLDAFPILTCSPLQAKGSDFVPQ